MKLEQEDFFLPDLCEAQSILLLVLVAELLVFVLVLATSGLITFDWISLGLVSLIVQWIVLSSAAILCNLRPYLSRLSTGLATSIAYAFVLLVTLAFSIAAEWYLATDGWAGEQTADVARNILIAGVMTGIAFRYFYLQHQLRQQEKAELKSRVQALQSRIRPHFLFNSMNIIASLISIDPELAEEVVEDLSVLFRASLRDSTNLPVPLREELALCEKYVHIESLRLDDRLEVEWQIAVDPESIRIPLLTMQPLLENAIYHGVQPLTEGGLVVVKVYTEGNQVNIVIQNPVTTEDHSHVSGNRMALENIRRRLEAIYGEDSGVVTTQDPRSFTTHLYYPLSP